MGGARRAHHVEQAEREEQADEPSGEHARPLPHVDGDDPGHDGDEDGDGEEESDGRRIEQRPVDAGRHRVRGRAGHGDRPVRTAQDATVGQVRGQRPHAVAQRVHHVAERIADGVREVEHVHDPRREILTAGARQGGRRPPLDGQAVERPADHVRVEHAHIGGRARRDAPAARVLRGEDDHVRHESHAGSSFVVSGRSRGRGIR
ncbi:hypothetical protein BLIC_b01292 [Bifidobacterium longum subsp. infantis]|uniref:Uncharacterized protein n=1 Tax=Bifidobacterium longum subsp. infantis TaxID=1682 RepID=A0ABP1X5T6_BIFLI|nr:hypothetical protein BLIC_a01290 [Bifidobacterium longum subsp. infantis]CEF00355.1 hypothetical protein BLIC_b01292 [Bifidobacterium longum subsp. infantis]CEF01468.1 hypothetical protein BLIC_c01296 [Bifidobacterium longum subsp. infantis]